jgi:NAD(P)-dependent dehydrogenase (short-subunit alcohol dehydrogenase family)
MSVKQLLDLSGRVALITGGSRGLGLQMGEALGEMGARLAITARKSDELDAAVKQLAAQGIEAVPFVCDLGDAQAAAPMVDAVLQRFGQVDVLVNNAGATWGAPTAEHPLDAWNKIINLNLTGAFLVTQAVGKLSMIPRRKGRIVNIASIAGLGGNDPNMMATLAYNTTKGGMVNMTRALASEWAQYGITVNAIAPGFFPSKMTKGTLEKAGAAIAANTPLGRVGGPEDLKGVAVLLASDASAYITGQIIAVDGGVTARL